MKKDIRKKLGLFAAVVLLPGGLILGTALVANHYRKKAAGAGPDAENSEEPSQI